MSQRYGVFGGSFNPPHNGHVEAVRAVVKKAGLAEVLVIPAAKSPLKPVVEGPDAQERLAMTELAFRGEGLPVKVDGREIKRGGSSYTIDTIESLKAEKPQAEFYLIMGGDKLDELDQWKDWKKLINESHILFVSRPGFDFPATPEDLPAFLQPFVDEMEFNFIQLTTGKSIQFVKIPEVHTSSTELRRWLRSSQNVSQHMPLAVESYIKEKGLYRSVSEKISDYGKFTHFCAQVLSDKKAIQIRGFDLREQEAPTEFALVASGTSTRHTSAMAENLMRTVKEEFRIYPQGVEGVSEGRWVVIDYGSTMIHLFYDFVRQDYRLEDLWRRAPEIKLQVKAAPAAAADH